MEIKNSIVQERIYNLIAIKLVEAGIYISASLFYKMITCKKTLGVS